MRPSARLLLRLTLASATAPLASCHDVEQRQSTYCIAPPDGNACPGKTEASGAILDKFGFCASAPSIVSVDDGPFPPTHSRTSANGKTCCYLLTEEIDLSPELPEFSEYICGRPLLIGGPRVASLVQRADFA